MPQRQEEEDARRNAALVVRAAIEFGKFMPPIFISDFSAAHPGNLYIDIERVEDYGGEGGWVIQILEEDDSSAE